MLKKSHFFADILFKGITLQPTHHREYRGNMMEKTLSIYETRDIMREDQRLFDKTVADLRARGTISMSGATRLEYLFDKPVARNIILLDQYREPLPRTQHPGSIEKV